MKIYIPFLLLALAGCANQQAATVDASVDAYNIQNQRFQTIPDTLFDCPEAVKIVKSKIDTMTETDIAKILFKSVQNNRRCNASEKAIKEYIAAAKQQFQKEKE